MQMETETMKAIVWAMRSARLGSLEESLRATMRDEEEALLQIDAPVRRQALRRFSAQAEGNVATLISKWLSDPDAKLEPHHVLHYRCEAAAWAIARTLEDALGEAELRELVRALAETP